MTGSDVSSGDLVSFVLYELQFTSAVEVINNHHCKRLMLSIKLLVFNPTTAVVTFA